jgi:hypothetical protein
MGFLITENRMLKNLKTKCHGNVQLNNLNCFAHSIFVVLLAHQRSGT